MTDKENQVQANLTLDIYFSLTYRTVGYMPLAPEKHHSLNICLLSNYLRISEDQAWSGKATKGAMWATWANM